MTNFMLVVIELGRRGTIMDDGRKILQFKGNYSYLIAKFMQPMCQSFTQLFFKSFRSIQESKQLINSIKQLVYEMKGPQKQYLDSLAHIQILEQPIIYAYTRILYKLSNNFIQLNIKIRKIVEQCIHEQIFSSYTTKNQDKQEQILQQLKKTNIPTLTGKKNNLIIGLILNCTLSTIFNKYSDWLYMMTNLSSKVRQILLSTSTQLDNYETTIYRCLLLLNFRLYMDDIIIEQHSDCGVILQIVNILSNMDIIKQRSNPQILLYIDIVEYYYKHFNLNYQGQKQIINKILQNNPNKYIISLQLQIMQKYNKQIQIKYVSQFVCKVMYHIMQGTMSKQVIYRTVIRIFNLLQLYFINRKQDEKIQINQIYEINKVISDLIVQIKLVLLKPKLIICRQFSQLLNNIIRTTNWRQNFFFVITKKYLLFLHIMWKKYKHKIQGYQNIYIHFQQILFKSTVQLVQQMDIRQFQHIKVQECQFDRRNNVSMDLRNQIKLYFIYTFSPLLSITKYSIHFQHYHYHNHPIKKLINDSIGYLFQYKYTNMEYSIVFILILHQIIDKMPQILDENDIQKILQLVMREANRKNKLLITDSAYLYRGKIYILFILLMKSRIHCVLSYFDKLTYREIDQNKLSGNKQIKIKEIFIEVFCNARNYAPHYDLPTLMHNLMNLISFLVEESNNCRLIQGTLKLHSKYIHFYIKLLLQGAQRLYIYQTIKTGEEQMDATNPEQLKQMWDQHTKTQLKSLYKLVLWITRQKVNLSTEEKKFSQILHDFVIFYKELRGKKQKWLIDVQNRLIDKKTVRNIVKIKEIYEKYNKNNKIMGRKIYTITPKQ